MAQQTGTAASPDEQQGPGGERPSPAVLARQLKGCVDRGLIALEAGNAATAMEQFGRASELVTRLKAIAASQGRQPARPPRDVAKPRWQETPG